MLYENVYLNKKLEFFCTETIDSWAQKGLIHPMQVSKEKVVLRVQEHTSKAPALVRFSLFSLFLPINHRAIIDQYWVPNQQGIQYKILKPVLSYLFSLIAMSLSTEAKK